MRALLKKIPGIRRVVRAVRRLRASRPVEHDVPVPSPGPSPRDFLLAMIPKGARCAEIGVHKGDFSARILEVVEPRELHLIDPWEHRTEAEYDGAWYGGRVTNGQAEMDRRHRFTAGRFRGRSEVKVHRGTSTDVLPAFPDGYFDWIYIDGDHLYEAVKADLELAWRKTKVGGFVTGDDYVAGGWWRGGVRKAVDEFVHDRGLETPLVRHDQFVLRR